MDASKVWLTVGFVGQPGAGPVQRRPVELIPRVLPHLVGGVYGQATRSIQRGAASREDLEGERGSAL
jgi:hypothetical protein